MNALPAICHESAPWQGARDIFSNVRQDAATWLSIHRLSPADERDEQDELKRFRTFHGLLRHSPHKDSRRLGVTRQVSSFGITFVGISEVEAIRKCFES